MNLRERLPANATPPTPSDARSARPSRPQAGRIELRKGNIKLDISVSHRTSDDQPQSETVTALARAAVARLG